jgi:cytoskeleton protein RodZ
VFEIGNSLREARERQGLGYPEIESATKIRSKYIRALEEEDFTAIPGDAYIRGFLRT